MDLREYTSFVQGPFHFQTSDQKSCHFLRNVAKDFTATSTIQSQDQLTSLKSDCTSPDRIQMLPKSRHRRAVLVRRRKRTSTRLELHLGTQGLRILLPLLIHLLNLPPVVAAHHREDKCRRSILNYASITVNGKGGLVKSVFPL